MRYFLTLALFLILLKANAQSGDFEVKVVSGDQPSVVGQIKKISAEGIGVEDYKHRYFIFRPNEIVKIKVRKRGLTLFGGVKDGTVVGLVVAGAIISINGEEIETTDSQWTAAAVALGAGIAGGALTGVVAQIIHTKLVLRINQNEENYKGQFKKLIPYLDKTVVEHVN